MNFLHKPCDGTELSQQNLQLCLGRHGLPFKVLSQVWIQLCCAILEHQISNVSALRVTQSTIHGQIANDDSVT